MGKTRDLFKKMREKKKRERGKKRKKKRGKKETERYHGNISCKDGHNKGQKWYGPKKQKILRRGGKNTQKIYTEKITMMVWSLT